MDRIAKAQIESLLYEVRHFPDRAPWDVESLARRYHQDPVVVRGLLESEGVEILGEAEGDEADPNGATQVMTHEDLGIG